MDGLPILFFRARTKGTQTKPIIWNQTHNKQKDMDTNAVGSTSVLPKDFVGTKTVQCFKKKLYQTSEERSMEGY